MSYASKSSVQQRSERRFNRSTWIALSLAIAIICITIWNTIAILTFPGDGWQVPYQAADALNPSWPLWNFIGDWHTPLQEGDLILAIEGVEFTKQPAFSRWTPPAGWQEGGTVKYTVLRAGQTMDINVSLHRLGLPGVLSGFSRTMQVAPEEWIWLFVGMAVFFLRPRDPAAQLLLIIGVSHSAVTKLGWAGTTISVNFVPPFLFAIRFWIVSFWAPIFWPSIILLMLRFPVPIFPLTRFPRLTQVLIYGIPFALTLYILVSKNPDIATLLLAIEGIVMFLVFGTAFFNALKHSSDATVRAQVLWVVLGFMLSTGIVLPVYILQTMEGFNNPTVDLVYSIVGPFPTLFLPLSLGIAITKYHLFDIQVIIRRTLVYSLLTGLLGVIYFGSVALFQAIVTIDRGLPTASAVRGRPSAVVIVLTTLAIAAIFNPLRLRLQDFIDRRFYRQKYDAEKALADFAVVARSETNLEQVLSKLAQTTQETLQPSKNEIWIAKRG